MPPIICNLASPPTAWWVSLGPALVGVVGLVLGIFLTSAVTRSREQKKYKTEKRDELYIDIVDHFVELALHRISETSPTLTKKAFRSSGETGTARDDLDRIAARIYVYGSKGVRSKLELHLQADQEHSQYVVDRVLDGNREPLDVKKEPRLVELNFQLLQSARALVDEVFSDLGRPAPTAPSDEQTIPDQLTNS